MIARFLRRGLVVSFVMIFPGGALAATDEELAQHCVAGWSQVGPTGAHLSYLANGGVQGYFQNDKFLVTISGTWRVQNGALIWHNVTETGAVNDGSFPIRMDENGRCFRMLRSGEEKPM
jgi:hypothetical protein